MPAILPGETIPELPIEAIHDYILQSAAGVENSPVGYDPKTLELPARDSIKVDVALAIVTDKLFEPPLFSEEQRAAFNALETKLVARAGDPKLGGRIVRNVTPPSELKLVSRAPGKPAASDQFLRNPDERASYFFQLDKPLQIEETIKVHAEAQIGGKTAKSIERTVVQVLPPKMDNLHYREYRPAYFYYLPPEGPRKVENLDQRRRLLAV